MTPASAVTFEDIRETLRLQCPADKCDAVARLWARAREAGVAYQSTRPVEAIGAPGRPDRPTLVAPQQVPRRRLGSTAGRAALIHAIAHIEFNAINLALDAAYRFRDMPAAYYLDWLSVASDEARHYKMLSRRLRSMGFEYGSFPAHNGLWEMAEATAGSCLERMALVPRVLEARGLDVTPGMIERLTEAGDGETVALLEVILAEEVRHVEIGTRWFHHCCAGAGVDPDRTFLHLLRTRFAGRVRGPFNLDARSRAGFSEREMKALQAG
ncbi:MAG: ferritin-like domain-containing protein [Gammaproteobacteria bacterium]